ncbi:PAS domain-containing sensor histidine kinase [Wenzhouxiangella sp. XN79A]|uniref:nitrogen regulation protein NR(II) n=1 Tax=Wenzhouxiangella sp. XN79A TaxID=2724193 RepID=UPI00144ABAA9|nr:nitrogen regulation protein NR(II) [Wenzhouxiangella sp. XN79A]NKI34843.1 PAS domain-containing sensor histidine kinase [Wenzhouxiangella sp. XN79A]
MTTEGSNADAAWLDRLQTALVHVDAAGTVCRMNAAAEDLLGVSAARAAMDPALTAAIDASGLQALCDRAVGEGRGVASQDLRWPLASGAEWLDARASRLGDGGVLLELQDAAPRRRAMLDRSREARRALSKRVVQQLAHEIRNPLAGLRGAAQLLARRDLDDTGRELAGIIGDEVDRLEALVEQLLGGARPVTAIETNLHAPLDRVVRLLAADAAPVALDRDYDPSLPRVRIDEAGLQQVFLNLARNAIEAGAGRLVFRTRAIPGATLGGRRCRLAVAIEVEDDGPGVPEELADSLFFPLVSGRPDGTGLGLAVAQDLVDRHGGDLDHERRGERTVFRVLLPADAGAGPRGPLE